MIINLDEHRLSPFEEAILAKLLEGSHPVLGALRQQAREAKVSARTFSGSGFFTDIAISPKSPRAPLTHDRIHFGDVAADLPELRNGAGFVLFVRNGFLHMLEGYSYDEPWQGQPSRFELHYDDPARTSVLRVLNDAAE